MSTARDVQCLGGYHDHDKCGKTSEYCGGYHEYHGGYLEYRGGVQYPGGYNFLFSEYLYGAEHPNGTHDISKHVL